MIINQRHY